MPGALRCCTPFRYGLLRKRVSSVSFEGRSMKCPERACGPTTRGEPRASRGSGQQQTRRCERGADRLSGAEGAQLTAIDLGEGGDDFGRPDGAVARQAGDHFFIVGRRTVVQLRGTSIRAWCRERGASRAVSVEQ